MLLTGTLILILPSYVYAGEIGACCLCWVVKFRYLNCRNSRHLSAENPILFQDVSVRVFTLVCSVLWVELQLLDSCFSETTNLNRRDTYSYIFNTCPVTNLLRFSTGECNPSIRKPFLTPSLDVVIKDAILGVTYWPSLTHSLTHSRFA